MAKTGRKKRRSTDQLRQDILESALQVFSEKGYGATTTRSVAKVAQASEPLIFKHFESKSGLYQEAVIRPLARALQQAVKDRQNNWSPDVKPDEKIEGYVSGTLRLLRENRQLLSTWLVTQPAPDSNAGTTAYQPMREYLDQLLSISRKSTDRNSLRIMNDDLETRLIFIFIMAAVLFEPILLNDDQFDEHELEDTLNKMIRGALGIQGLM